MENIRRRGIWGMLRKHGAAVFVREFTICYAGGAGLLRLMEYIYEHYDEFKLIICKSGGTMYEDFAHRMAKIEEEATGRYMDDLRQMGVEVQSVDAKELHLLVTSYIEAVFQPVVHDFSKKEALHYAQTLEKFYIPAWKALFGI